MKRSEIIKQWLKAFDECGFAPSAATIGECVGREVAARVLARSSDFDMSKPGIDDE